MSCELWLVVVVLSVQKSIWLLFGGGEGERAFILLHLLIAGWSRDCLLDWGSFIRLAVPGMLMMCIEWWTFELGSFLAGESKSSFSTGSTGHLPAKPALVADS